MLLAPVLAAVAVAIRWQIGKPMLFRQLRPGLHGALFELVKFRTLRDGPSLIGPRPLPARCLDRYTPEQARRHEVRPGVAGLAQVRGRNDLAWEEKLAYGAFYVDSRGLLLDLRIEFETVGRVLRREGIAAPGIVTAPEYIGVARD